MIHLKVLSLSLLYVGLISFGKVTQEQKDMAGNFDLKLYSWDEFLLLVGYLDLLLKSCLPLFFDNREKHSSLNGFLLDFLFPCSYHS